LIIETPRNVADVNTLIKVSINIEERIASITDIQRQMQADLQTLQLIVQKLGNSATSAITESQLTQSVNQELIEKSDEIKNRKKASKKEEDKISDARVLSKEMMDKALAIKAAKKKAAEEELAKRKRLKAQEKAWTTLYNQTLVQMRKWGLGMLQEVEDILPDQLPKTPKARKKAPPKTPKSSAITLPVLNFPDLPATPLETQQLPPETPKKKRI
jgi:hypothetical protein